ncbi:hypothetical protein [Nocardioides aquiterrae]|uniref:hypothetical protein n=1 Tax=Nocardioides aquiterrae TaxID=203799 RepID=UPI0031D38D85
MTQSPNEHPPGKKVQGSDKTPLYRVAYDQGLRTLDDQRDEFNAARGRAVQFMALVAAATAFLVGTGLNSSTTNRDGTFYAVAIAATALTVLALVSLFLTLSPRLVFNFRLQPQILLERWIDREVPGPTEPDLLRALAARMQGMIDANETILTKVRIRYMWLLGSGTFALLTWAVLAWARG